MSREAEMLARLQAAEWLRRPGVAAMLGALDGAKGLTRPVGGIVRDTLLGLGNGGGDIDIATELVPEEVMARAERHGIASYPTGIEHGTVTLRHDRLTAEVTTLRQDVETDGRHARVRFGRDWVRDAERRDFTLNALYANVDGTLFDPLGGLADLAAGRVRFIGDADRRIAEDGLRVYRFFRFSASHGGQALDPEGLAACRRAAGNLGHLSAERIGGEMLRMLGLPAIAKTLAAMREAGVLPDIKASALEALLRLEAITAAPSVAQRLAVLAGDGEGLEALKARWRLSNELVDAAAEILAVTPLFVAGQLRDAIPVHSRRCVLEAADVAAASRAEDSSWLTDTNTAIDALYDAAEANPFPLKAADLLARGYTPGPALGAELARLEEMWSESVFARDRQALLAAIREP